MPEQWIVGWAGSDDPDDPEIHWLLQITPVETAWTGKLHFDQPFTISGDMHYLPIAVLSPQSTEFFSGLDQMVSGVNGGQYLLDAMGEALNAAYEAGRRGVVPPADT